MILSVFEHKDMLFNEGCDARLAGLPYRDCPYSNPVDAMYWKAGWKDVNERWGADAKWPYQKLAEVR